LSSGALCDASAERPVPGSSSIPPAGSRHRLEEIAMRHLGPSLALLSLAVAPAAAQHRLDRLRLYPITSPIKHAGTVDVTTGRWTKPGQGTKAGKTIIYNNTCTWQTQAYYAGFDWCEEVYDEGRIPSPSDPNSPPGALAVNQILSIEVSYCTYAGPLGAAGGYDMDLAFFNKLGGDCVGGVPPTPPSVSSQATIYLPLAGLGLPGSTGFGFQACWLVTLDTSNAGFTLAADGEGSFDGSSVEDSFLWMQRQNTTVGALQLPGSPDGFFLRGEPATGGFGACSYNIPCGIDAISGETCGTGLDMFDAAWINVDGIGVGAAGQPAGCANSVTQYGFGTNCYFWRGYPEAPLHSYWLVLEGDARDPCVCDGTCHQVKSTSVPGCKARLTATNPSLATGTWTVTDIPAAASSAVVGIFLFTHGVGIGPSSFNASIPFGTLCLEGFTRSTPTCAPSVLAATAGCNPGPMTLSPDCNGGALGIAVGEDVNVQFWHRDPAAPGTANLSNAIFYTVQ
jgi:hypothetical protein